VLIFWLTKLAVVLKQKENTAVLARTPVFTEVVFLQLRWRCSLKVLWWVDLGWLLKAAPAVLSLPLFLHDRLRKYNGKACEWR